MALQRLHRHCEDVEIPHPGRKRLGRFLCRYRIDAAYGLEQLDLGRMLLDPDLEHLECYVHEFHVRQPLPQGLEHLPRERVHTDAAGADAFDLLGEQASPHGHVHRARRP